MNQAKMTTAIPEAACLIKRKARRAGLDFRLVIFEVVDFEEMTSLAATAGFPVRWSHWIYGQEFELMRRHYKYGLSTIYEMVINTDPAYAYLLNCNTMTDHKTVMAHVFGHCDFFKNNVWLSALNPKMADEIADHAIRIRSYTEEKGHEVMESFLDDCLSLVDLVDLYGTQIKREPKERDAVPREPPRVKSPEGMSYLDEFLNPPEWLESRREELKSRERTEKAIERGLKIPVEPTRDILGFLVKHAPLELWQRDVLSILREENLHLAPQGQTRIMNEGWASYWHSKLLTELGVAESKEIVDYALHCAGAWAMRPGSINPYKLGLELWRDIEWRWDSGRHGTIYENCDREEILDSWDGFVVFKVLDQQSRLERWDEWCAFKETLSQGRFGFPRVAWDEKKLVKWWCDYQVVEEKLKELAREGLAVKQRLKGVRQASSRTQDQDKAGNHDLEKTILGYEREDIDSEIRFWRCFLRFKRAFHRGEAQFKRKTIPASYFTYAKPFRGEKIEIGKGLEKIFEIRRDYNDINFISEFFTSDFCKAHRYYAFEPGGGGVNPDHYGIQSTDPKDVRQKILFMLTNLGRPIIYLADANYGGKGELYLKHLHEGVDLSLHHMRAVLQIVYKFWQKKVHLETILAKEEPARDPYAWLRGRVDYDPYARPVEQTKVAYEGERMVFSYDGSHHEERKVDQK